MIINIKGALGLSLNRKQNIALGIQKWLIRNNLCINPKNEFQVKADIYESLLKQFCRAQKDFDESKVISFCTYESYVNNRFSQFKKFCKEWSTMPQ